MNNSSQLFDSPQHPDVTLVQSDNSPHVFPTAHHGETHVSEVSENSEGTSSDKLSALPSEAPSPSSHNRTNRAERNAIPNPPSAPSQQSLLGARPFPSSSDHHNARAASLDRSIGKKSPHQRVYFEGSRSFTPTPNHSPSPVIIHPLLHQPVTPSAQGINSTMARIPHPSDPPRPPSIMRVGGAVNSARKASSDSPVSPSAPHSRATSPIRIFNWSGFHRTREDPFIPVDPFQPRTRPRRFSFHSPDIEQLSFDPSCQDNPFCCLPPLTCSPKDRFFSFLRNVRYFIVDTLPRQFYLHMLLRLPSLYFSRIARVYEDAQLSKPDLDRMIQFYSGYNQQQRLRTSSPIPPGAHYHPDLALPFPEEWTTTNVSPALVTFKHSWEAFIDSLMREWKTLNLVSALLLSAILSMFQNSAMAGDPIVRTAALLSLTCALMSLCYGCVYIVRFGTMRSMYKATRWAEEAGRTTTFILWNVWVLLAMPSVWLAWSMIFFIIAILSFVWRSGSTADSVPPSLSPSAALGPRIALTAVFLLGLVYFVAIVKTLHTYGRPSEGLSGVGAVASEARVRGRGRERQGRRERSGGQDREPARSSRGRERTRRERADHEREATTDRGGLSAVMGLGLTGLDAFASPRSSDEMVREKHQGQAVQAGVDA
ncbi:hypothetical protein PAXINDRAFT_170945 [Paxillus involutus ATCC 200175]|uniref:Uncharacterized protein n=1 Tax=Paxillus involutus ATCC 200175 TaxID=664439 RepID=A0A0C9TZB6_PAXIN|nr:hypothetical protein PAXINDRAFT_170945 [Paxillus involutus ATCC 200175]